MKDIAWTDIDILWEYACSGNIEKLKEYYENGGSINNRHFEFGESHSLIMGAFRNNQFDTVEYLMSEGEELSKKEYAEMRTEMRKLEIMQKLTEPHEPEMDMNMINSQTM